MKKILLLAVLGIAGYYLYNADALYGQYLFTKMCKNESGARFYKQVEKGQGWRMDKIYSAYDIKHLGLTRDSNRGFIRFKDGSGNQFDARLKAIPPYGTSGDVIDGPEYTLIEPANLSVPVRYTEKYVKEKLNPDPRWLKKQSFGKQQFQIIDLASNEIAATYTGFGYQWTSSDRVILNGPTAVVCPESNDGLNAFRTDIYTHGMKK
jgi:hypothetical protein